MAHKKIPTENYRKFSLISMLFSIDLKNSWKVKAFCRKDFAKFEVLSDRKGEVELRPTVEPIKKLTGYEITG